MLAVIFVLLGSILILLLLSFATFNMFTRLIIGARMKLVVSVSLFSGLTKIFRRFSIVESTGVRPFIGDNYGYGKGCGPEQLYIQ